MNYSLELLKELTLLVFIENHHSKTLALGNAHTPLWLVVFMVSGIYG
tara:strand:- start:28819 stop:28959 length:141 start_codon:yes stop_codon:yes gene_type:complete